MPLSDAQKDRIRKILRREVSVNVDRPEFLIDLILADDLAKQLSDLVEAEQTAVADLKTELPTTRAEEDTKIAADETLLAAAKSELDKDAAAAAEEVKP